MSLGEIMEKYRLWKCDNGTFDVLLDGDIVFHNLGYNGLEFSAWAELHKIINNY